MLNKLLKTLKSQKSNPSEANANLSQTINETDIPKLISKYQMNTKISQTQACIVEGPLHRIRYFVLQDLPDIMNLVLGCSISYFHELTFSQRRVKEINLKKHNFPHYLEFLKPLLNSQLPTFNHLLINHYPPGIGIMPHTDGPAYASKVVVLSLNSFTIINFQQSCQSATQIPNLSTSILLQPNSIHIFEQEAYESYLHGIQNLQIDSFLVCYKQNQVRKSSISNFKQLECGNKILLMLKKGMDEMEQGEMRICRIESNDEWTHKVQIIRKQRVSITIRQQYKIQDDL